MTLTESIKEIEDDIIKVLTENQPIDLSQDELYAHTHLKNKAEFGWSFAIEKLEKKKLIKVSRTIGKGVILYKLA